MLLLLPRLSEAKASMFSYYSYVTCVLFIIQVLLLTWIVIHNQSLLCGNQFHSFQTKSQATFKQTLHTPYPLSTFSNSRWFGYTVRPFSSLARSRNWFLNGDLCRIHSLYLRHVRHLHQIAVSEHLERISLGSKMLCPLLSIEPVIDETRVEWRYERCFA